MVSYYNHLFIVHDTDDNLYVYDKGGKLKKSVKINHQKNNCAMKSPQGMCLVHGGGDTYSLVISDQDGKCLWWLATEKHAGDVKLGQPQQQKLHYSPYGISTDRSGRVVVANSNHVRINVYGHFGEYVRLIQLSAGLHYPMQVLTDQSDGFVVTNLIRGGGGVGLTWVNSAGEKVRSYDEKPRVQPDDIVNDGTDLIVSDRQSCCVHIVTMQGKHDGHLITDIDPTCVCLDPVSRRLWVAWSPEDCEVQVIEMSYTPRSSPVT